MSGGAQRTGIATQGGVAHCRPDLSALGGYPAFGALGGVTAIKRCLGHAWAILGLWVATARQQPGPMVYRLCKECPMVHILAHGAGSSVHRLTQC